MSEHDLDFLYKRASAQDSARPSAAAHQAILEHARRLADERRRIERTAPSRWSRWFARWPQLRWQIGVPLAAAALAVILWQPLLRSTLPAPAMLQKSAQTKLQESAPPASAAGSSASAPRAPLIINMPQPPPEPFPAAPQEIPGVNASPAVAPPLMPPTAAATLPATPPVPAARAPEAPSANLGSNADVAASQSAAPATRRQASPPAAPLAELREIPPVQSKAAAAASLSSGGLREAASQGDVARVRSLLQQSAAPIDARDARGRTALMLAVLHGHETVVRALLEQGADPNIGDVVGRTPLGVAREQHRLPMVEALLQAGAR